MTEPYDSGPETLDHVKRVMELIGDSINNLAARAAVHDNSKFQDPEKPAK